MKDFKNWTPFEKNWLIIFSLLNLAVFFIMKDSILGLVSSLSGMLGVILEIKGKISTYYLSIIKVSVYSYISFQYSLYNEFLINFFFYLPLQFIGLYQWKKHRSEKTENVDIEIRRLTVKNRWLVAIFTILSIAVYSYILNILNFNTTGLDAFPFVFAIIGQILMVSRYYEQWLFWSLVNVFSIPMWLIAIQHAGNNNYAMVVMYTAFLVSSIYGYFNWKNIYRKQSVRKSL